MISKLNLIFNNVYILTGALTQVIKKTKLIYVLYCSSSIKTLIYNNYFQVLFLIDSLIKYYQIYLIINVLFVCWVLVGYGSINHLSDRNLYIYIFFFENNGK